MVEKERVCVTGGGGYQASWLVKLLLSKGYMVHATVRDPDDEKNAHLKTLENASENLQLFKTDLLDYNGLLAAIKGCTGVFHLASPIQPKSSVPNTEMEIIEPAVTGTSYVLKACSTTQNVKRVVVVSSMAAVMHNPNWPKDHSMDESCWSDEEYCKTLEDDPFNWYYLAKTIAERQALEYGKKTGLDVVTVCPSIIIGPMLQSTKNASSLFIYAMLKGFETMENKIRMAVDVRDMAEALLLVYENPEAEGRYICSSYTMRVCEFVDKLKSMYPNYNYPKQITEVDEVLDLTSEKLQKLGWRYRSLEETIKDSVKNYQERGMLE